MAVSGCLSQGASDKVVSLIQEATGHSIAIIGQGGRILSSSTKSRIGTTYDVGRRIMAGELDELSVDEAIASTMKGEIPGYTAAVRFDGKLIGCIRIGGNPVAVKPIQRLAALSLRQELERERLALREQALISDVRRDIADIAERMQVLSLNGAVLAARLGENGRGFKIVVAEMRELAAQIGQKMADLERREASAPAEGRQGDSMATAV